MQKGASVGGDDSLEAVRSKHDPDVVAFAQWFADWWLRCGRRLGGERQMADLRPENVSEADRKSVV